MSLFPIIDVPRGSARSIEQLGTKPKFWFQQVELGSCLCKLTRPNTGEDWSEKLAAELASLLGLPHARYEFGVYEGQQCVISPRFLPETCTLVHGNEWLGQAYLSYGKANVRRFRERVHTLEAVWGVLQQTACELPLDWQPPPGIEKSAEVFVGYLLLDAVVGNTDRHEENWALVEVPGEAATHRHLAPTFDHASCLGCHLTDRNRRDRLATRDSGFTAEAYADRARSAFFLDETARRPLPTLVAFQRSAERWPKAARVWTERLRALRRESFDDILAAIPPDRCSEASAEFARRMLLHNRRGVLAASGDRR